MKVAAGKLKGRLFTAPPGSRTHPMAERVRSALFNALGDIEDLRVLDAFAGSGALGFEALSRGAHFVLAIDIDRRAQETIAQNRKKLGITPAHFRLIKANAASWSERNAGETFDIVFVAPPYDHLQLPLIQRLAVHVNKDGLLVLDWPGSQRLPAIEDLQLIRDKSYGDAQLGFYRRGNR